MIILSLCNEHSLLGQISPIKEAPMWRTGPPVSTVTGEDDGVACRNVTHGNLFSLVTDWTGEVT